MSIRTISPVDGRVYAERMPATAAEIDQALERARTAQRPWRHVPLAGRAAVMERFCSEFEQRAADIATGLTWQMGRPIRYAPSEVRGTGPPERRIDLGGGGGGALGVDAAIDRGDGPDGAHQMISK